MKRIPFLLLAFVVVLACTDTVTQPDPMDLDAQAVLIQGAPAIGNVQSQPIGCASIGDYRLDCGDAGPGPHSYKLKFWWIDDVGAVQVAQKGTVVWWGCVMNDQIVDRDYCEVTGEGRWIRKAKSPIVEEYSTFTFFNPGPGNVLGMKWKYFAQGSGMKNMDGWILNIYGDFGS